jgi:hypothetical protein
MALVFEPTRVAFALEISDKQMIDLMDSESHVTNDAAFKEGNSTLCEKLDRETSAHAIEYNGHFGAAVYLTLDVDADTPDERKKIASIIEKHLKWCAKLKKR